MWADSGYNGKPLARWAKAVAGITIEVVARSSPHSFQVIRRRWVVERTFGWLMRYRRLARDYERTTAHHEAMIYWATVIIMTNASPATKPAATRATLGRRAQTPRPAGAGEDSITSFINRQRLQRRGNLGLTKPRPRGDVAGLRLNARRRALIQQAHCRIKNRQIPPRPCIPHDPRA